MLAAFLLPGTIFSNGEGDKKKNNNNKSLSVHPVDPENAILKQRPATAHLPNGMLSGSTAYGNNLWANSLYSFDIETDKIYAVDVLLARLTEFGPAGSDGN